MTMAQAFNEWMRRYTKDPRAFAAEFEAVAAFQHGPRLNGEPVYGREMAAYLRKLMREPARETGKVSATLRSVIRRRNKRLAKAAQARKRR